MSEIIVTAPMIITSRLMPGVKIVDGSVNVQIDGIASNGRVAVTYIIDFAGPGGERLEYIGNDVRLSNIHADAELSEQVRAGAELLLSFLEHAAECYRARMGRGQDASEAVFSPAVDEWAYQNSDEIAMARSEFEGR